MMNERDLAFRCAALHADRGFKDVIRRLKADVLERWANEKDKERREALWFELQTVDKFAKKVAELADTKRLNQRKEDAAALKRARRVDNNANGW